MTIEELKEQLDDALHDLPEGTLIYIWNEYCEEVRYYDDMIYFMESLDDLMCGVSPTDLLSKLASGFDVTDNYYKDTVFGLESFNNADEVVDFDDLVDYIIEQGKCDEADIQDILDEYEETKEESEDGEESSDD